MSNAKRRPGSARIELRANERTLFVDGVAVKLGARAFDLLVALVERRDRLIGKNELVDVVWPGLVVEENNLQVQVSTLRKVLGPQAITTVPGLGYRFTLDTRELELGMPEPVTSGPASMRAADHPAEPLAGRTNLPRRVPFLYGRAGDIGRIGDLLAMNVPVTIAGAGGIGKTRLAEAVAHVAAYSGKAVFADGVWMVELASLSSADLVGAAILRALCIPHVDERPPAEILANALQAQSLLLVLDNCEHVLETVGHLVEAVVRAAPNVRILVTSQEPLKVTGEHVIRLEALTIPPAEVDPHEAGQYGAVQLFVERAKAAEPSFTLTPANASSIVDICRRLDGIPLALELAAARVKLLGVDGLRARLDERLQLLTGGSRFVLRRHQTLRAALEFSHALLTADEQLVFRRLGVFAGSFTAGVAQEVAADEVTNGWAVLDHLSVLIDKSILVCDGASQPRLRLLETTRAYALEKLADVRETAEMLRRHAYATAKLFRQMDDEFWRCSDDHLIANYEPELDNQRAAIAWGLQHESEVAIELVGHSRSLWLQLGLQPEGLKHCQAALERVSGITRPLAAGRLWQCKASMITNVLPIQARDAAMRAIALLRQTDDTRNLANAIYAQCLSSKGHSDEQVQLLDELRRMDGSKAPPRQRMLLPYARAVHHRDMGRLILARKDYELARELSTSCGATFWGLVAQTNVADIALRMGDLDLAIAIYEEMAGRLTLLRDRLFYCFAWSSLSTALLFKSDTAAAREALTRAVPLIVRYDLSARYAGTLALLAAQEGRLHDSARLIGFGDSTYRAHGLDVWDPPEAKARDRALELVKDGCRQPEVDECRRSGEELSVENACQLALNTAS